MHLFAATNKCLCPLPVEASQHYAEILEENLLPIAELLNGPQWEFKKDSTKIHTANNTETWFCSQNIKVLD